MGESGDIFVVKNGRSVLFLGVNRVQMKGASRAYCIKWLLEDKGEPVGVNDVKET